MTRSKTSKNWLTEHFNDPYVKRSQEDGYRSRASYKLLELQKRDDLFKKGMTVVDLGAAPGGWCQVAKKLVGSNGLVLASDILPMDFLPDVEFVQGDFTHEDVFEQILARLDNRPVDLVISDMAPNMSGISAIDQPRAMALVELAFDFAHQVLTPGGAFVAKVFQGEGSDTLMRDMRKHYGRFVSRKPDASRARSREVYWVGKGFKGI
ncbi:MAG: 23S rRNA (uridine2552-2'-O)-methyltransferase [Cellvibrionaceae bacterium]|jgi:23S rRNA (uridine2552-2'-O)-methyltransferase